MPNHFISEDFSGGINNNVPENQIEDNEVTDALNVVFDKTSNLKTRGGVSRINYNKNLLKRTEEFDHADWNKFGCSVTPNSSLAPNGTNTADELNKTGGNLFNNINQTIIPSSIVVGNLYTVSIYFKKDITATKEAGIRVRFDPSNDNATISVDITSGTISQHISSTLVLVDSGIEEISDYYRVWVSAKVNNGGDSSVTMVCYPNIEDNSNETVIIWGAQLERGIYSKGSGGYHKNIATAPTQNDNYLFDKITSILDFKRDDGTSKLILTSGSDIWRLRPEDYLEKITGSLSVPDDTYWQWVIYNNTAIGVNRATNASGKTGIIKIEDHVSDAQGLDWNRNHLLYTEQFQQSSVWGLVGLPIITVDQEENPIDGGKNADYIKDDATNLLEKNEEFDDAYWTLQGSPTITPDTDVAPDGLNSADTIEDTDVLTSEGVYKDLNCADSEIYVGSVFIKKTTGATHFPCMRVNFTGGGVPLFFTITIDTDTGTITPTGGPLDSGSDSYTNYWRVWIKVQNNATSNNVVRFIIFPSGSSTSSGPLSVAPTGSTVFWGAQLELDKLTNYHQPSNEGVYQEILVSDSETYVASIYIRKTSGASHYPVLRLKYLEGTTELECGVIVDTNNGVLYDVTSKAPDAKGIIDTGANYWRVWIKKANNATKNDICRFEIFPAYASALTGALDKFITGQNTFWGAQLEEDILSDYASNTTSSYVLEPPNGNYITVWNNRVWVIDADDPNTVVGSGLGDHQDWATPGSAGSQRFSIGGQEGDICTGLGVFKDRIFIFKSDRIYYIQPGNPNTDITQYEIKELTNRIGCVSGYSIQLVTDDLVFLSKYGVTSISAVEQFGDFENSVISQKINDLSSFKLDEVNSASVIDPSESQYWLAAPLQLGVNHSDTWVMDYTNLQSGGVGFTRFNGRVVGASYGVIRYNGRDRIYVGGYPQSNDDGIAYIYRYGDLDVYNDDGNLYNVSIKTKSHSPGQSINNSEFIRIFFIIELISSNLTLSLSYRFNESAAQIKSWAQAFTAEIFIGALWDSSKWDMGSWAASDTLERRIVKKVLGSPGRISRSIQFSLGNVNINEAFIFKGFGFDYVLFTHKKD